MTVQKTEVEFLNPKWSALVVKNALFSLYSQIFKGDVEKKNILKY